MAPSLGSAKTALDASSADLKIVFPSAQAVPSPGARLSRSAAGSAPQLCISTRAISSLAASGARLLAVMVDLDAPFPSFPVLGPILHWVQTDLLAGSDAGSRFVELRPGPGGEKPAVAYVAPRPPPGSAPHRYVVMVWEQPEGASCQGIREGLRIKGAAEIGNVARMRWDQEGFEKRLGLGRLLAANWFVSN